MVIGSRIIRASTTILAALLRTQLVERVERHVPRRGEPRRKC
jgi:hypothetical protein